MTQKSVIPTERELDRLDKLTDTDVDDLVRRARESDQAARELSIIQSLKRSKKAVFWAMLLSLSLFMEGYDVVISQFKRRFGVLDVTTGEKLIPPSWQSGLANSALVGELAGLVINSYCQDRFGCRMTIMAFMGWMLIAIFVPVFAPSLPVLAFGEALCGVAWGVFQTLTATYACEIVPTILRPYVTAWVNACWGFGILLASGVIRAVAGIDGDLGWRLPFYLQWIWPVPMFVAAYLAPESPWNSVRRGKLDEARQSLMRLREDSPDREAEVEADLAYIRYTTELEKADSAKATILECFRGINLRRTEINCVVWMSQILNGNPLLSYAVVFLQAAGFKEVESFDINISLSACFVIGTIVSWFIFPRFGRASIYIFGLTFMFCTLVCIGGLGFASGKGVHIAIGVLLVISTLCNLICIAPTCYPIVAETPSGRLRYKTIAIGRFAYNLTNIFQNSITPRMLSPESWNWGAKAALFYAGTNLLCNLWCWFRLPETKDRPFGEIDLLFENQVSARKFKSTKVDQFAGHDIASTMIKTPQSTTTHLEKSS